MFTRMVSFGRSLGGRLPGVDYGSSLSMPSEPDGDQVVHDVVHSVGRLIDRGVTDDRVVESFGHYIEAGRTWDLEKFTCEMVDLDYRSHRLLDAARAAAGRSRRDAQRLRARAHASMDYSERLVEEEVSSNAVSGIRPRSEARSPGRAMRPGAADPDVGRRGTGVGDPATAATEHNGFPPEDLREFAGTPGWRP